MKKKSRNNYRTRKSFGGRSVDKRRTVSTADYHLQCTVRWRTKKRPFNEYGGKRLAFFKTPYSGVVRFRFVPYRPRVCVCSCARLVCLPIAAETQVVIYRQDAASVHGNDNRLRGHKRSYSLKYTGTRITSTRFGGPRKSCRF